MISLGSRLIACCILTPTLARQMWRHNYVIGRNEYLISTLLECTIPWVYSLQFLFKSTNNSWRYERKCEWVSGLQFCRWHHDLAVVASQNREIRRNSDKIWPYSSSRLSKVIDLCVNRKPTCNFLLAPIVTLALSATVFEILTLKNWRLKS